MRRSLEILAAAISPNAAMQVLAAACLVLAVSPGVAHGSEPSSSPSSTDFEEIVVTAQRRSERALDVPLSITAFDDKDLDSRGVRNIADIASVTPGLNFSEGNVRSSGINQISIRGISSNGGAGTTGIYIDDTPIQARMLGYGVGNAFPSMFDVERIEVLRGPQGTLFGAGSEGGTVRFISPKPDLHDYSTYARAELATTAHGDLSYEAGAAIGGPVSDGTVGFRASASYRQDGGYIDRVDFRTGATIDSNANHSDAIVARLAFAFVPATGVTLTPGFYYQQARIHDASVFWPQLSQPGNGAFRDGNVIQSPGNDTFYIPELKIEANIGSTTLYSVSSYFHRQQQLTADYTELGRAVLGLSPYPPPGAAQTNVYTNTQKNFTQELRLQSNSEGDFSWVAGAFYQHSEQNATQYAEDLTLPAEFFAATGLTFQQIFGQGLADGRYVYVQDPYAGVDVQTALFGQVDYRISDHTRLTAGLRAARTTFDIRASISGPFGGIPFTDRGSQSESPVTPKIGLSYQPDSDHNYYAIASKGYRVGGYNPRQLSICQPQLAAIGLGNSQDYPTVYKSDSVWSYELGGKMRMLDHRLAVNASAFYIKWSDIQQFVPLSSCAGGFMANLGRARSTGGDIDVELHPTENLSLALALGYTDAQFTQTVYAGPVPVTGEALVTSGDAISGAPFRGTASAQYGFHIADHASYVRADYSYSSHQGSHVPQQNSNNGISYSAAFYGVPQITQLNLRAGMTLRGLDISLFVSNLFDSAPTLVRQQDTPASPLFRETTLRPRTIGMTAIFRR